MLPALTCLSTGHQISLGQDNGDGVLLYRCWFGVAAQYNVVPDDFSQVTVFKL